MREWLAAALLAALTALPRSAGAAPTADEARAAIRAVNNSVSAAYSPPRLNYGEPSDGQVASYPNAKYFDTETGWLTRGGLSVAASLMRPCLGLDNVLAQVSFSRAIGKVHYNGFAQFIFGNVPLQADSLATIEDWGLVLGKGFAWGDRFLFTPLLAYGYHAWDRDAAATFQGGTLEHYRHHSIEVGNRLQFAATQRLVLTGEARFGTTLFAHIDVPGVLSARLGSESIANLSAEADYAVARWAPLELHVFGGWRFIHFGYGQSAVDAKSGYLEPFSMTDLNSYQTGLRFSF